MSPDPETYAENERLKAILSPEAALCYRRHEYDLPGEEFEKALEANPNDFYARLGVAVCCAHTGKMEQAAKMLVFMHRTEPSRALLEDLPTIVEVVTHCLEGKPAVWLLLAEELLLLGDREQAEHIVEELRPYVGELPKFLVPRFVELERQTHGGARRTAGTGITAGCQTVIILALVALIGAAGWWWWSTKPQRVLVAAERNLFRGYLASLHHSYGRPPPRPRRTPRPAASRLPKASPSPSPSPVPSASPAETDGSESHGTGSEYLEEALEGFDWLLKQTPDESHLLFCAHECCSLLLQILPQDSQRYKQVQVREADLAKTLSDWKEARAKDQEWYDKRCRAIQEGKVEDL